MQAFMREKKLSHKSLLSFVFKKKFFVLLISYNNSTNFINKWRQIKGTSSRELALNYDINDNA